VLKKLPAIAFLLLSGCAASAPQDQAISRFRQLRRAGEIHGRAGRRIGARFCGRPARIGKIFDRNRRTLPASDHETEHPGHRIDLAGEFELYRGPQADQVRITKGLYPPRIMLEFEVIDDTAAVVRSGKRDLTDLNYQLRNVYPEKTTCAMKRIFARPAARRGLAF
jgi:hypothetical protein